MTGVCGNGLMHRKRARRILGIWEKSVSWVTASEEQGWLLLARRGLVAGVARGGGGGGWQMEKSS